MVWACAWWAGWVVGGGGGGTVAARLPGLGAARRDDIDGGGGGELTRHTVPTINQIIIIITFQQCCGSGSVWIQTTPLDPFQWYSEIRIRTGIKLYFVLFFKAAFYKFTYNVHYKKFFWREKSCMKAGLPEPDFAWSRKCKEWAAPATLYKSHMNATRTGIGTWWVW